MCWKWITTLSQQFIVIVLFPSSSSHYLPTANVHVHRNTDNGWIRPFADVFSDPLTPFNSHSTRWVVKYCLMKDQFEQRHNIGFKFTRTEKRATNQIDSKSNNYFFTNSKVRGDTCQRQPQCEISRRWIIFVWNSVKAHKPVEFELNFIFFSFISERHWRNYTTSRRMMRPNRVRS